MTQPRPQPARRDLRDAAAELLDDVSLASSVEDLAAPRRPPAARSRPSAMGRGAPERQHRRRRSAGALPPLPVPADVPEDAEGRVEFIVGHVLVADGRPVAAPPVPEETTPPSGTATRTGARVTASTSIVALVTVAAIIVAVFLIGMRATG